MTTIKLSLWFSCSSEAVAITDITGCGNKGTYIAKIQRIGSIEFGVGQAA
jgi:hypothetical protein